MMPEPGLFTVIILAGGKSSRMKTDKGLLLFRGKPLVEHVIDTAKKISSDIIIVTGNPAYREFGYPCVEDEFKDRGPLGGIYTGLMHSASQKNLLLGCDMPFLSENLLNALLKQSGDEDVLLLEHRQLAEPLCSIYDKNAATHIRSLLEQNQLKITTALAGLKTRLVSFDDCDWFTGTELSNINSLEELKKFGS